MTPSNFMTTTMTDEDYKLVEAKAAEHLRANRQRIVEAANTLSAKVPPGMGTSQEAMEWRLRMANLVGALQCLAASGDLSDNGVKEVVRCLGRVV